MRTARRWLPLAAMLLMLPTAPAAAQDSPYSRAVAARKAGHPARAVKLLEPWLASHPDDVDSRLQLGYALLALGRLDDAETAFTEVLKRSPDYADARQGLALIAQRHADPQAKRRGFVLVEGALDAVDDGRKNWKEAGVTLSVPTNVGDTLDLHGTWYQRFGLEDTELGALYTHRAGENTWLRFGGSATPSADFRPKVGLTGGFDHRLSSGGNATVVGMDISWRKFPAQDVWTGSPFVTQYLADGHAMLTARTDGVIAQGGPLRIGGLVRADYLPNERTRLFVGAAAGPDTDLGIVTETRTLFGGGELPLNRRISLTASISREWRNGPGDRTEGRVGIKVGL